MKRIKILSFCCIAVFLLTACGNKITVKGEDGTEYESYQECCAAQDFQAAHQFLAKMENGMGKDYDKNKEYEVAREYVFKQEALYLMSIGDETAQKRILYLLKEEGAGNDAHIGMLIDLAIENDEENFVKALMNQFKDGYKGEYLTKIVDYLATKPSEENNALIDRIISESFSLSNNGLVNYLAATNDKKNAEIIIGKITEEESKIKQKPKMGVVKVKVDGGWAADDFKKDCNNYSYSVKKFNEKCQTVLGAAIKNKNLYLAQRIVQKFKTNITVENPEKYKFVVSADNEDVTAAKNTLNDAIRSGAFK